MFFVLEGIGLIGGEGDGLPTLTEVITVFLPGFVVFMAIGWFIWHFIASYHDKKKLGDGD